MTCDEAQSMLMGYILGQLDRSMQRDMAYHFCACERCRRDQEVARLLVSSVQGISEERPMLPEEDLEDTPIVHTANSVLFTAIEKKATEIYIQPRKRDVRVLYRIKGWIKQAMRIPKSLQEPLIIRFKIMSHMNLQLFESRQQSTLPVLFHGQEFILDVQIIPGNFGDNLVFRIQQTAESVN